jgi:hypothetical protein
MQPSSKLNPGELRQAIETDVSGKEKQIRPRICLGQYVESFSCMHYWHIMPVCQQSQQLDEYANYVISSIILIEGYYEQREDYSHH